MATGEPVQKILRPSSRQPLVLRRAVADGRVRSWPGSLIAVAITTPSRAIAVSPAATAAARRVAGGLSPPPVRTTFTTVARCMFTPIASEGSPCASRLDATTRSCTDVTPMPPSGSGTGAA